MISEEKLRTEARAYEKLMLDCLPNPDECEASFSPKFERKMKKLIRRTDHPYRYWVQKSAACFLLAVLLGGGSLLTFSTDARAAFFGWMREVVENFFVYRYVGEDQEGLGGMVYRPTWVPDGYKVIQEDIDDVDITITYQNEEGELLAFICSRSSESIMFRVSQEDAILQQTYVGEYPADLYLDRNPGGGNVLIWQGEEESLFFDIWATFSGEEMIKMAESIEGQEKE